MEELMLYLMVSDQDQLLLVAKSMIAKRAHNIVGQMDMNRINQKFWFSNLQIPVFMAQQQ